MNRRICRQVLECGDGVCEVTALAVVARQTGSLERLRYKPALVYGPDATSNVGARSCPLNLA